MADDITKRVNYFPRQFLHASDFKCEQDYHIDRRRRHNRMLHQHGVAEGLEVSGQVGAAEVTIAKGTAINRSGEEIVLLTDQVVPLTDFLPENNSGYFDVYVVYIEQTSDPVDRALYPDVEGQTRFVETCSLVTTVRPRDFSYSPYQNLDWESEVLALHAVKAAKICVQNGKLTGAADNGVRERAGVRFGETLALNKLTLTPDGSEGSGATLTCPDDGGNATLKGGLRINGEGSNPYLLHVQDSVNNDTGLQARVSNTSTENHSFARFAAEAKNGEVVVQFAADGLGTGPIGTAGGYFGTYTNHPISIVTGDQERIRIQSDGEISVGGVRSDAKLNVNGAVFVSGSIDIRTAFKPISRTDPWSTSMFLRPYGISTNKIEEVSSEILNDLTPDVNNTKNISAIAVGANFVSPGSYTSVPCAVFDSASNFYVRWVFCTGVIADCLLAKQIGNDSGFVQNIYAQKIYATDFHGTLHGEKRGFVTDLFVNSTDHCLEQGDVTILFAKSSSKFWGKQNTIPFLDVDLTDKPFNTRVCGIVAERADEKNVPVDSGYLKRDDAEDRNTLPDSGVRVRVQESDATKIFPGQIGTIVTLGAYAFCKVDADIAPIEVGDLLTTSPTRGHAQKVKKEDRANAIGAIIGKALGSLASGKGKIPVLVTLQ